jgi:ATP-dependent Lon protease
MTRSGDDPETRDVDTGEILAIPDTLPVLQLADLVIFPYMIVPLFVPEASSRAVDHALSEDRMILAVAEDPKGSEDTAEPYRHGTVASIMRMLKLPDERVRILVQGVSRARAEFFTAKDGSPKARIFPVAERQATTDHPQLQALARDVKALLARVISLGKNISQDVAVIASNLEEPGRLADLVASNLDLGVERAQVLLETYDPAERLRGIHRLLSREVGILELQNDISAQAKGEIDRSQREFFLRQQMRAIQQELGEGNELSEEIEQYRDRIRSSGMPEEASRETERLISRLERMHPDSTETASIRNYLDCIVDLPWAAETEDNLDLGAAKNILDEDHFGLSQVKERILEHLAVRKLKGAIRGPILCFVGPPGVGKTSLGRSIARALGRHFVRLSLGGVHDEAEIRGHRRTYVGAMPGRIIQCLRQSGSRNPVFMLDEVDKIGSGVQGDPSSALLEVLDPEQNHAFRDNFLGLPFDLSQVMFITTANVLDTVQPAFRDRMEVISLGGYAEEEKLAIAQRHLVPRQLMESGLDGTLPFTDDAIRTVIRGYTKESGLRSLEREIGSVCRKVALRVATGKKRPDRIVPQTVGRYLGRPRIFTEARLKKDLIGVATGLAWTPAGGEILCVEATQMRGRGVLTLTGQLGEVMRESAQAALSYTRSHASDLSVNERFFSTHDVHVHVPEGAIPKDGPSAGLTMAIAMISLLSGRRVRRSVAMTGEITLRGQILPVGGVKEKVLAARRAGIHRVILPRPNKRDLEDIGKDLRDDMEFTLVDDIRSAAAAALGPCTPSES